MANWDYQKDINYSAIDVAKVKENRFLFHLLTIASFIEIASETYAKNLSEYYQENAEAVAWLNDRWEKEEVQHGKALKAYVAYVWPEFPWQKAYGRFLELYLPLCSVDALQPTKGLEMIARMIIETGTSTMYRAFEDYAKSLDEPVFAHLSHLIYKDEVNHYSNFNRYFNYYNQSENSGRKEILKVIVQRLKEAGTEDIETAYQSIHETKDSGRFDPASYDAFKKELNRMAKKHYPYPMAIKMIMHPLHLNKAVEATMIPVVRGAMRVLGV
ncbi:ferritin-like domain-containing protein [Sulfurimonas sp. HSL3-7]|uniref:ferritin-like domain-containing protein n=1 Tax=Sulfonitrofixus jiaomeiensis TaxID=3131938 RepID=UPI0031F798CD